MKSKKSLGESIWCIDSGYSRHTTRDTSKFSSLEKRKGEKVVFGDNSKGKIIGIGNIGETLRCKIIVGTGASRSMAANGVENTKQMSALIVDDDTMTQKIHKKIMTKLGFETQVVENGKKAVDLHTLGSSFEVILMDMEMPVMNGLEATKELRAMGVEAMIVGVTALSSESEKQVFMEAGLNECIVKPLNMEKAKSVVKKLNKDDN